MADVRPAELSASVRETFSIRFPDGAGGDQDSEWCEVQVEGERRRFRFHDYHEIYAVPGLYEQLFYDRLECRSPATVRDLLATQLEELGHDSSDLRVLDLGAGNGIMGEELDDLGVESIVGVDILGEAGEAAERDRPELYDDYLVADFTKLSREDADRLARRRFTCLTSVAALGFGDIPPLAFANAFDVLEDGAWVAFTIKDTFLSGDDGSGFAGLVRELVSSGRLELQAGRRYRHRLAVDGTPLFYAALVGVKQGSPG